MSWLHNISMYLSKQTGIKEDFLFCVIVTIFLFLLFKIIKKICSRSIKVIKSNKKAYIYSQNTKIFLNIIQIIAILFVWNSYLQSFITLISLVSAAITVALKDVILNLFSGIYIKIKKLFEVEDRIEINGFKGDVVNLNSMNFEALEVNDKEENGQSTGIIVTFPNSIVFSYPVKNQLIVELLELGILKYNEDMEIKNSINLLIKKVENLCESISSKL